MARSLITERALQLARGRLQVIRGAVRQCTRLGVGIYMLRCVSLVICAVFLFACEIGEPRTVQLPDRHLDLSQFDSLEPEFRGLRRQLADTLALLDRMSVRVPGWQRFTAAVRRTDQQALGRMEGYYLIWRDTLLAMLTSTDFEPAALTDTLHIGTVLFGTDSCAGGLFPYAPPAPIEREVGWRVHAAATQIADTLGWRLELPPVDPGSCRLAFAMIDRDGTRILATGTSDRYLMTAFGRRR